MRQNFYSNGKLLLAGEYSVTRGSLSIGLPTKLGQKLSVSEVDDNIIHWKAYNDENKLWLESKFELPSLKIIDSSDFVKSEFLGNIFKIISLDNPQLMNKGKGYSFITELNFNRNWGLGTSSTLINLLSQWSCIDQFRINQEVSSGSGYDLACAQEKKPILFKNLNGKPTWESLDLNFPFVDNLFFVYLNRKQNTQDSLEKIQGIEINSKIIDDINQIITQMIDCNNLDSFNSLLEKHENLISETLNIKRVKETEFKDFKGQIKSLGAWGGDFILATGEKEYVKGYFQNKGLDTIIPYKELVI